MLTINTDRASLARTPGQRLTIIGLMTGTAMDGIDAALLESDGQANNLIGPSLSLPFAPELRTALLTLAANPYAVHPNIDTYAQQVEQAHAKAVWLLLAKAGLTQDQIDLVGFHGQTLHHAPARGRAGFGRSWQLGDGERLARLLQLPVAWDFRTADVMSGGEGAPFAPIWHAALLKMAHEQNSTAFSLHPPIAILNIGGVANVTWIGALDAQKNPSSQNLLAFDTGPGNGLLDDWMRQCQLGNQDENGQRAASGQVQEFILEQMQQHSYFDKHPPKSLDRFTFSTIQAAIKPLSPADGAATLTQITASCAAAAQRYFPRPPRLWLICGGGRHNATLMKALTACFSVPVYPIEAIGCNGDALEAQAFAYLAVRSLHGFPLSFPSTTAVPEPMPGGQIAWPSKRTSLRTVK